MCTTVADARRQLQQLVASLDADVLEPAEAERLVGEFATIEHAAAAGKALAAARVAGSGRWRESGHRSEAEWLAAQTGESVGAARAALATIEQARQLPATADALRNGELSPAQASAVASAAAVDPAAEQHLLGLAKATPLTKLRDACDRVRAAATDAEERHRRIHRDRYWRRWTDAEGARCGTYRLNPELAAVLEAAAEPHITAAFHTARREGREEPAEAYAADGLVAMARAATCPAEWCSDTAAESDGPRASRPATARPAIEMVLLVDLAALQHGHVHAGETCEIAGVGPVPVSVARDVFGDALLRVVIRDGIDIRTVVHAGRHPNPAQRTALLVRDGGRCVRPGCGRPVAQIDHTDDYADRHHPDGTIEPQTPHPTTVDERRDDDAPVGTHACPRVAQGRPAVRRASAQPLNQGTRGRTCMFQVCCG